MTAGTHRRILVSMSKHPAGSAKNDAGDFARFSDALKQVLSVPHSEIKAKLDAEKKRKAKASSSSRASHAKH